MLYTDLNYLKKIIFHQISLISFLEICFYLDLCSFFTYTSPFSFTASRIRGDNKEKNKHKRMIYCLRRKILIPKIILFLKNAENSLTILYFIPNKKYLGLAI